MTTRIKFVALLTLAVILSLSLSVISAQDGSPSEEIQRRGAQEARQRAERTGDPRDVYIADWYEQQVANQQELVFDGQLTIVDGSRAIELVEVANHQSGTFLITFHFSGGDAISGYSWYLDPIAYDNEYNPGPMSYEELMRHNRDERYRNDRFPDPPMTDMVLMPVGMVSPWSLSSVTLDAGYRLTPDVGHFVENFQTYWSFRHSQCPEKIWVTDGLGHLWDVTGAARETVDPRDSMGYTRLYVDLPLDWQETMVADPATACQ